MLSIGKWTANLFEKFWSIPAVRSSAKHADAAKIQSILACGTLLSHPPSHYRWYLVTYPRLQRRSDGAWTLPREQNAGNENSNILSWNLPAITNHRSNPPEETGLITVYLSNNTQKRSWTLRKTRLPSLNYILKHTSGLVHRNTNDSRGWTASNRVSHCSHSGWCSHIGKKFKEQDKLQFPKTLKIHMSFRPQWSSNSSHDVTHNSENQSNTTKDVNITEQRGDQDANGKNVSVHGSRLTGSTT